MHLLITRDVDGHAFLVLQGIRVTMHLTITTDLSKHAPTTWDQGEHATNTRDQGKYASHYYKGS